MWERWAFQLSLEAFNLKSFILQNNSFCFEAKDGTKTHNIQEIHRFYNQSPEHFSILKLLFVFLSAKVGSVRFKILLCGWLITVFDLKLVWISNTRLALITSSTDRYEPSSPEERRPSVAALWRFSRRGLKNQAAMFPPHVESDPVHSWGGSDPAWLTSTCRHVVLFRSVLSYPTHPQSHRISRFTCSADSPGGGPAARSWRAIKEREKNPWIIAESSKLRGWGCFLVLLRIKAFL